MKKLIALVLTCIILVLFVGCQEAQPQNAETSSNPTTEIEIKTYSKTAIKIENVLKVCSGELSKEDIKSAINTYQNNYENVVVEKGNASGVSFETDFDVSSCSVPLLSPVDDTDIEVELHGYIDLAILTECDGRTVTIPIDWWDIGDGSFIWSYVVRVIDTSGIYHYYYFRVDYSAYAE